MNPFPKQPLFPVRLFRVICECCIFCFLSISVFAQETTPQNKETTPAPPAEKKTIPQEPRYVFAEPEEFIDVTTKRLRMNKAAVGPFGFPQRYSEPVEEEKKNELFGVEETKEQVPLSKILSRFPINAVFPKKEIIFSDKRIYRKNQKFKLLYKDKPYLLQVLKISSRSVLFKNLENGKTAVKPLKIGTKRIKKSYRKKSLRSRLRKFSTSEKALNLQNY